MRSLVILVSVMASGTALAGAWDSGSTAGAKAMPHHGHMMSGHSVDANGDGVVSCDEAEAFPRLAAEFDSVDGNKDGQPDKDVWEAFEKRLMLGDRVIELPLARALSEAAQYFRGTGGAPAGEPGLAIAKGALSYPEMRKNKK